MRPLHLSLQAFGPFAEREQIDFTCLGEHPLFLIHGPTGSGKSSILDGICVALFGTSSGGERRASELRSHHAAETLPTELVFEFGLGSQRYRLTRAPEQSRPSRRARNGFVLERTRATLEHYDGARWRPLAERASEVDTRVRELIGFDVAQFTQVMMLPQGQFRRVLSADSNERERILETLFDTDICKQLQDALQQRAHSLREAHGATLREIDTLLAQRDLESLAALEASIAPAALALDALVTDCQAASLRDSEAADRLGMARMLEARFVELQAATESLAALRARHQDIELVRQRRDTGRRAANCMLAYQRLADARERAVSAAQNLTATQADAQHAEREREARHQSMQAVLEQSPTTAELAEQVQAGRRLVERLLTLEQACDRKTAEDGRLKQAQLSHAEAAKHCLELEQQRDRLSEQLAQIEPVAARVQVCEARREAALQSQKAAQALAVARRALDLAMQGERDASATHAAALLALKQLESAHAQALDARFASQAASVASQLSPGQPCPVCGSSDHPSPAHGATDADLSSDALNISAAELTQARRHESAALAALSQARIALAAEDSRVQERSARPLEPEFEPMAELDQALTQAKRALSEKNRLNALIPDLKRNIEQARAALDAQVAALQSAQMAAAAASASVAEHATGLSHPWPSSAEIQARVATLLATQLSLEQRREQTVVALAQSETALAAARARAELAASAVVQINTLVGDAQTDFEKNLAAAQFNEEREFLRARLDDAAFSRLDAELARHDESLAAARERMQRAQAAVQDAGRPDLGRIEREYTQAKAHRDALMSMAREAEIALASDRKLLAELLARQQQAGEHEQAFARIGSLADLALGRNDRRMTFQRYVLAALLDEVLLQASERLLVMTHGRFWLRRQVEAGDMRRAQGLELEVFDDYTGRPRPVATLSGGEGFLAALALALGLSDIVQARAGGVHMDTLFVDEGFGSLDAEALDMAMRALLDLRSQGRMVGIISHVEALREQIEVGIELIASASGSHIRCHGQKAAAAY